MPYNNYNNGYRNNNNRNNNRNNRNFNGNNRPAYNNEDVLSLRKFKQKNIKIEDMNGKPYIINGNFATEFIMNMIRVKDRITAIQADLDKPEGITEMFDILKRWCLDFINMNVDGIVYTMSDVNAGFNDFDALSYLFNFIVKTVNKQKFNEVKTTTEE